MKIQLQIFAAFFRIGILGFGGGPSMIPLFQAEVVSRYRWMTVEEFGDVLAIGNTLPGPIATKMAGYIGYRVAGISGCLNAVLALIVPSILLMVLFLVVLNTYKSEPWVNGMGRGVVPVVAVMMATLTWEFFSKGQKSLGWPITLGLCAASFVAIELLSLHPGLVIGALLLAAMLRREKPQPKSSDDSAKASAP